MIRAPLPRCEGLWKALAGPRRTRVVAAMIALAGLAAFFGLRLLFWNYSLSRDEDFADFDATIFQMGHLVAPVASEWRAYVDAFTKFSVLPVPGNAAWVSNYLPVNAAFRALAGLAGDRMLANSLMAVVALSLIYAIARKLWPERRDAAFVGVVVVALSPQFLITAMTPFAMTAHLALNALWLALFLRGGVAGHAGAAVVGFLATGLHQIVFHPLFAAPFILLLLWQRRYAAALWYVAAYAVTGIFWIEYFQIALRVSGVAAGSAHEAGAPYLWTRIEDLMDNFAGGGLRAMDRNLLRYIGWQHLLMAPLFVAGCAAIRRGPPVLLALAAGLVLAPAAMFVLTAYQGYGWGYRYMHGVMLNSTLIAAWGWISLTRDVRAPETGRARAMFLLASAISLFVLLPSRVLQARAFNEPFARASAAVRSADADIVLVDPIGYKMAFDLVRNDPFLRRRPVVLDVTFLTPELARDLCGRFSVVLFEAAQARAYGIPEHVSEPEAPPLAKAVRDELRRISCAPPMPAPR